MRASEEDDQAPRKSASLPAASNEGAPAAIEPDEGSVQFKNVGIKEKLSDSDSATSWDLGLAYKEMGLFEDAIHAFEIVLRDPKKTALAKTMIGICQTSLARMDEAVRTFNQGLKLSTLDTNEKMGLLYELGKTYQMMGQSDDARRCYQSISEIDAEFADVAARIRSLKISKKSAVRI